MYQRNEKNQLIVKDAWMIPQLPMSIVIELPDGALKFWGVRQNANQPQDNELRDYKGYHPSSIPTADKISDVSAQSFSPGEEVIHECSDLR